MVEELKPKLTVTSESDREEETPAGAMAGIRWVWKGEGTPAENEQRPWFSRWVPYILIVPRLDRNVLIFLKLNIVIFLSPTYKTFL